MTHWWQSLSDASRIFWGIAIFSSVFQVLMFAGGLFSGHEFDHSPDADDGSTAEGVKLLSLRAITAFLVGFGWAGALFLGSGKSVSVALLAAVAFGGLFMVIIFLMMRAMVTLKADGTLDYANAIGQTGHTYVTIPAARGGQGQVEIMLQGRLATISAVTDSSKPLSPGTPVFVDSVEGKNLLVVSPKNTTASTC